MYLISIEGCDASGKETQSNLLYETLRARNISVKKFSFPNYNSYSSDLIKAYLAGKLNKINAYGAATLFAIDRYITYLNSIEQDTKNDVIYIIDRYTGSNMIHQGHKIVDCNLREEFFEWIKDLEYNKFMIPKPDIVFYLYVDLETVLDRIKSRKNQDIHEIDQKHLENTHNLANQIYKQENWEKIECVEQGKILSKEEVLSKILQVLENKLDLDRYTKNQ